MIAASSPALPLHPRLAANDPVGEIPATPPLRERFKYQNPQQRKRPPFQKRPEKDKQKPDDEHKVDDYA